MFLRTVTVGCVSRFLPSIGMVAWGWSLGTSGTLIPSLTPTNLGVIEMQIPFYVLPFVLFFFQVFVPIGLAPIGLAWRVAHFLFFRCWQSAVGGRNPTPCVCVYIFLALCFIEFFILKIKVKSLQLLFYLEREVFRVSTYDALRNFYFF
ncbi:unnamed protein product [Ceratitis capitata]|uniref:(Mediterranean fruit fly) hypothetical protein n=1 Tax=Ceratitis capitata TaxID=7213 RepID=A0A811VAH9_CERCA|nr:unnamed protein product [Ceratitis capitata]